MDVKHLPQQLTLHLLRDSINRFYFTFNWSTVVLQCCQFVQQIDLVMHIHVCQLLNCVCLCNSMTIALQTPLSMQFSRQEYWSGLPFPTLGDFPDPGMEPGLSHCMQTLCHLSHQGSPYIYIIFFFRFFSHIGYYRILSRVPCGLWQVLVGYLFHIQQCVSQVPNLSLPHIFPLVTIGLFSKSVNLFLFCT